MVNIPGWISVSQQLPVKGQLVETMVCDRRGQRNKTTLVYHNFLWFTPDYAMYVYYVPTHWRPVDEVDK